MEDVEIRRQLYEMCKYSTSLSPLVKLFDEKKFDEGRQFAVQNWCKSLNDCKAVWAAFTCKHRLIHCVRCLIENSDNPYIRRYAKTPAFLFANPQAGVFGLRKMYDAWPHDYKGVLRWRAKAALMLGEDDVIAVTHKWEVSALNGELRKTGRPTGALLYFDYRRVLNEANEDWLTGGRPRGLPKPETQVCINCHLVVYTQFGEMVCEDCGSPLRILEKSISPSPVIPKPEPKRGVMLKVPLVVARKP